MKVTSQPLLKLEARHQEKAWLKMEGILKPIDLRLMGRRNCLEWTQN
jgi:hypothetical protein